MMSKNQNTSSETIPQLILAFLVFGYALANILKSIIFKTSYDIEGEKKEQMYRELEKMRKERHRENESV